MPKRLCRRSGKSPFYSLKRTVREEVSGAIMRCGPHGRLAYALDSRRLVHPKTALFCVALLGAAVALAQSQEDKSRATYKAQMESLFRIEKRIQETHPHRRESPIRGDNITDIEVQEIQSVLGKVRPGDIVNIGTVVSGCPCEDGTSCSDQVWVVAHSPGTSVGLLLSRISNHWGIGPVQQWWLDREDLTARRITFRSSSTYFAAEDALTRRFPACLEVK
jgi:hypothetical protein